MSTTSRRPRSSQSARPDRQRSTARGARAAAAALLLLTAACGSDDDEVASDGSLATTAAAPTSGAAPGSDAGPGSSAVTETDAYPYGTGECPAEDGSTPKPAAFTDAPRRCIEPGTTYQAVVTTNHGAFTITLDAERSPGTANNFVTLARYRYYDGTGCHRVISGFVVQCGRPGEDESAPGYNIADELPAAGEYAEGLVAMANTGLPNSGGGQWFVITGPNGAALPPSYSIVGRVTEGYDTTVKALEALADPDAQNGVPTLEPIEITSVEIVES